MESSDSLSAPASEPTDVAAAEPEAEPEPAAAPVEEPVVVSSCQQHVSFYRPALKSLRPLFQKSPAEETCEAVPPEEPKAEVCDMPCQMELAVESAEMSVESALGGHMVPEVSIEG